MKQINAYAYSAEPNTQHVIHTVESQVCIPSFGTYCSQTHALTKSEIDVEPIVR